MACYKPLTAYRLANGDISFVERGDIIKSLSLPCGQCVGCRLERSRQWAMRIMHEASNYGLSNSFITLTYNDDNLPSDLSLNHSHFQKFFKRLRKFLPSKTVRYYMCGEYGDEFKRPHYHACIFNHDFPDREVVAKTPSGHYIYRSQSLERLWPFGFSSVGDLTFESAAYVARYVMKKITGDAADTHYQMVDTDTGEIFWRVPEYNRMSLKPGIGADWFDKYRADVYPHDEVIANGVACKPPRYYDKMLKRIDPLMYDDIKCYREIDNLNRLSDNTPERLEIRERLALQRLSQLKRSLK